MKKRILDVVSRTVHNQYTGMVVSLTVAHLFGADAGEGSSAVLGVARVLLPRPRRE